MATRYYGGLTPQRLSQSVATAGIPGPEVISMYDPEGMQQLIAATGQRQQRFDIATQGVAAEAARIGELETYDKDELTNRLTDFETNINKLVQDKYNGDYGAAANEIAMKVASERSHPFYVFNKQKVDAAKTYQEDMRRLGANFLAVGDPLEVSFDDWKKGEDLTYVPINKQDIVTASANTFKDLANVIMSDSGLMSTSNGQYFKSRIQRGFANKGEVLDFLSKEGKGMFEQVYNSMPELKGIKNQQAVLDAITQGAYSAIGRTDIDYMPNRAFDAEGGTQYPQGVVTTYMDNPLPRSVSDFRTAPQWKLHRDRIAKSVGEDAGLNVDTWEDLEKIENKRLIENLLEKHLRIVAGVFTGGASEAIARTGGRKEAIDKAVQDLYEKVSEDVFKKEPIQNASDRDLNLNRAFKKAFKKELGGEGLGLPKQHIDRIAVSHIQNPKLANAISDDIDNLNIWTNDYIKSKVLKTSDKFSEKNLGNIKGDKSVEGFAFYPTKDNVALVIDISGDDADGKSLTAETSTSNPAVIDEFIRLMHVLSAGRASQTYLEALQQLWTINPQAVVNLIGEQGAQNLINQGQ